MVILTWNLECRFRFHFFMYEVVCVIRQNSVLRRWRRWLILFLAADLFAAGFLFYRYMDSYVPDQLYAVVGETEEISLPFGCETEESREVLQVTNKESGFSMVSGSTGNYQV